MNTAKKNEIMYYVANTLYNTSLIVASGAVLQTFLLEMGVVENTVARYISVFQVIQSAAMMLFSLISDRTEKVIKVNALSTLNLLILLIPMLVFSIFSPLRGIAGVVIFAFGIVSYIVLGFYNVIAYKLPYHIMNMAEYGRITANGGVLHGITGIIVSGAMTYFIGKYEYFDTMTVVLTISALFAVTAFIISSKYKNISLIQKEKKTERKRINIFRYKPFQKLIIPNLTRGIGMGIIGVTVTIGYYFKVIDKVSGGYIVILTNAAVIFSCFLYSRIAKKGRNGKIILISALIALASVSFMLVGKSTVVFLTCYGIGYFAINLLGQAIPVQVTEIIDYDVIGQYTAWRMMLLTIGTAIGGFIAVPVAEKSGGVFVLFLAGLMFLITGIGYFANGKASDSSPN